MEYLQSVWQIGIIALVTGAMIGVLAYRLLAPSVKQADKIKTELDEAREELASYKTSVNQHFNKTSELVNDMTQNYVKVYQHLAAGAKTLGDSKTFTNLLELHQGKVSIAVVDETSVSDKIADDFIVDTAVTQAASVKTVGEHSEPFTGVTAGETDPVNPEDDSAKAKASESSDDIDSPDETMESVLNVDALEEATKKADIEARADAASVMPEDEGKIEVRTTTH